MGVLGRMALTGNQGSFLLDGGKLRWDPLGIPWPHAGDALGEVGGATASGKATSLATGDSLILLDSDGIVLPMPFGRFFEELVFDWPEIMPCRRSHC